MGGHSDLTGKELDECIKINSTARFIFLKKLRAALFCSKQKFEDSSGM
jgi:hypothetical protein